MKAKWKLGCSVIAVLAAVAALAVWWFAGSAEDAAKAPLPKPTACPVVSNELARLERVLGGTGARTVRLDVRKVTCAQFRDRLAALPEGLAILWMPGESDWLLTSWERGRKVSLQAMMDRFVEEDGGGFLADLFAGCVGEVAEVMPAFAMLKPDDFVVPELFVPREIPSFDWLSTEDVEPDVLADFQTAVHTAQAVRREILEGNIQSRRNDIGAAVGAWKRAAQSGAGLRDSLLRERLQVLALNGKVFTKVGQFGMAANCFETIVCICPDDYVALVNLGTCYEQLKKPDLARTVFGRAEEIRGKGSGNWR